MTAQQTLSMRYIILSKLITENDPKFDSVYAELKDWLSGQQQRDLLHRKANLKPIYEAFADKVVCLERNKENIH